MKTDNILQDIINNQISAVTFIYDYIQFFFNNSDSYLNSYVRPVLKVGEKKYEYGELGYCDKICELIGKSFLTAEEIIDKKLVFKFSNSTIMEISLEKKERKGLEAVQLQINQGEKWNIW